MQGNSRVAVGIAAANVTAGALVLLCALVVRHVSPGPGWPSGNAGIYIFSTFTLIPILMGYVLEWYRSPLDMATSAKIGTTLLSLIIAILISTTVLREGAICLVMAFPLVLVFHAIGVHIAYRVYKHRNGRLEVSIVPLLLLLMVGDLFSPHQFRASESDTVVIHARPEVVWRYIVAYPENRRPVDYWLWKMGLPAPVQSRVTANAVGAHRTCAFTGGVAAEETITALEPARRLAFDVVRQPDHPEVVGHFTLERGEFLLRDNGDGSTTVTGTSWYSLHVFPSQYYDLWVRDIVGHVHLRVMNHIKALAEASR